MTDQTIRIALAGCGGIALSHARAVMALPEATLAAVVDVDEARARTFADRFHVPICSTNLAEILELDEIDAVIVTTANDQHAPLTIQSLNAGKHVMVQKPMALSLAECDAMIAAAEASGKQLMVSYFELFHPAFKRAREIVQGGLIGNVFLYKAIMAWNSGLDNWRFNPAVSGGGILMDGHAHHVAYFNWLLDNPPVRHVYSEMGALASDANVEDTGVTIIRTTGAIAEISGSNRLLEPNMQNGHFFKESVEIFGTNGTIHIHPTERPSLRVFIGGEEQSELSGGWVSPKLDWIPFADRGNSVHFNSDEDPWTPEHRHFVEAVRNGTPVLTDGHFGKRVQEILLAGYQSAQDGQVVRLDAIGATPA